jgi:hypothetical protein
MVKDLRWILTPTENDEMTAGCNITSTLTFRGSVGEETLRVIIMG